MIRPNRLQLRDMDSSKGFLFCGDTGVGKSTAQRQLMHYARSCGDAALVLDGKGDLLMEFYEPRKGHKIINPKDNRTILWNLAGEATDETDSQALFTSMFPLKEGGGNGEWFDKHARDISAYLHVRSVPRPSCATFGHWLANPDILLEKVKGTRHFSTLNPKSPNQQSAVLGTMNQIGAVLSMMPHPEESEFRESFTVREWAENPDGWLFFTNTSDTRDALRPLQTGMIDYAMMRVMSRKKPGKRVWFFFDEVASLGKLAKLVEALTMIRSTGNVLVLGIQNVAQLKKIYGEDDARTIFSQPYTKMIFATTEPHSAKDLESLIGEVERVSWRESKNDRGVTMAGPEFVRKPLVLASEVSGLPDLEGYVLQRPVKPNTIGMRVVHVRLPYVAPQFHCQALVERVIPDDPNEIYCEDQAGQEKLIPAAAKPAIPASRPLQNGHYTAPPISWIANNSTRYDHPIWKGSEQQPEQPLARKPSPFTKQTSA